MITGASTTGRTAALMAEITDEIVDITMIVINKIRVALVPARGRSSAAQREQLSAQSLAVALKVH
jgi:hypothetical protein